MARFNTRGTRPSGRSPIATVTGERARTHEGATGYLRDARSELFLLAVSNLVATDTFYESADDRDDRYSTLVRQLAVEDPEWTAGLLGWLRGEGNMRTAALVGAAEFVRARIDAGEPGHSRQAVDSVLQRADEPGELLGYWTARHGRRLPKPVKRGIADAVQRLYNERSLLKYDTDSKGYRFGDVLNLAHPAPATDKPWQGELFQHALDRRHGNAEEIPERLRTLRARERLMRVPVEERHAVLTTDTGRLAEAAMTWESLAGWLQRPMDAAAWEAIIPSMGLMALARNLRNFDESGVSDEIAQRVAARFADADEVRRSRMFPFRFWAAYKHAPSLRWGHALERALAHSLAGVPALPGRSLILVDRSPSMFPGYGFSTPHRSDIPLAEQAAVFGAALAMRAEAPTLVEFGMESRRLNFRRGGSVLRLIESFGQISGTDIPTAVKKHFTGHDRVVVVTDEQTRPGWFPSNARDHGGMAETEIDALVPGDVPVYMWNMAGYKVGATPSGGANRHAFGGLTDQAFRLIPLIERGGDARWPWEN
ncbi:MULTISPECIES: TROVE domain-containing protein [unclassified Streptomyces]|uniref:TROVE domain-containing protein n=1 Tax=unclassified Streptomyces TaxID=2593676 RepID=UPI00225B8EF5|nr:MULTISPECIES: TROVE domain-containing protein [unclassified Streptomyces]MCX4646864.1 TROVE domain-containing protein [Streptomyces sp. NBC_01446]MCX5319494.1 TROVE domain-containing protein [Streptomyces sp. NBC_00120]